jgi:AraC-like DNA-binding protein
MTNAQGMPDFNASVTGIVSPWRYCHDDTPPAHRAKRKPDQVVQRGHRHHGACPHRASHTMPTPAAQRHAQRFDRVPLHIEQHFDDELSLDVLSAGAHYAPFHFHRAFSAYVGVSVGQYVQRMRLRRASFRLVSEPQDSLLTIAL